MAAVNCPKTASSNVHIRLKFGKISREEILCAKMEKMGIENFIVVWKNALFEHSI